MRTPPVISMLMDSMVFIFKASLIKTQYGFLNYKTVQVSSLGGSVRGPQYLIVNQASENPPSPPSHIGCVNDPDDDQGGGLHPSGGAIQIVTTSSKQVTNLKRSLQTMYHFFMTGAPPGVEIFSPPSQFAAASV